MLLQTVGFYLNYSKIIPTDWMFGKVFCTQSTECCVSESFLASILHKLL